MKEWYSNRFDFIDHQLEAPPALNRAAGPVTNGAALTLACPSGATIYYTLDGSDPRAPGGAVAANARAYTGPIVVTNNVRVVARCRDLNHSNTTGDNNLPISSPWSGPTAATFYTHLPPLLVTEIMYHPPDPTDPDDFEFIELKNIGGATQSLLGLQFVNGLDFVFTATNAVTSLAPGAYAVLVKTWPRSPPLSRSPPYSPAMFVTPG